MQKKTRDDWKKVVTGMKEVLEIDLKTRHITSTVELQEAIKKIAFQYVRKNKQLDPVTVSEERHIKAQIDLIKSERDKYKRLYEETTTANNMLIERYLQEKNKSWFKKLLSK